MPEADPPTGPTPPGSPARSTAAPERAAPERAPPAPDPDPFEYKDLIIEHIFENLFKLEKDCGLHRSIIDNGFKTSTVYLI